MVLLEGCSGWTQVGQVEGTVLIDGQPAPGFEITWTAVNNPEIVARGVVAEEGKFRLYRTRGNWDVPVGEYWVTLEPVAVGETIPASKIELPEAYRNPTQATVKQSVQPGPNELTLEISR